MKKFDVVAANGEYTDQEGQPKTRWLNCGVVLESDKGYSLKLECIPVRRNDKGELWFQLFEPKPRQAAQPRPSDQPVSGFREQPPQEAPPAFVDSEIPF